MTLQFIWDDAVSPNPRSLIQLDSAPVLQLSNYTMHSLIKGLASADASHW